MIVLYGASGHGKVIFEILEALNKMPDAIWDDADKPKFWNYDVVKPSFELTKENYEVIISIGDNKIRRIIAERISNQCSFTTAIHPKTLISNRVQIGEGSVVMPGATINADTTIGKHAIINTNSIVEHDCILGDFVHISPNVTLCGNVNVGTGTHIGASATIIPGIVIGKNCVVGAGSIIIRDISDNSVVAGNPGRSIKNNS